MGPETIAILVATFVNAVLAIWNVIHAVLQFRERRKIAEIEGNLESQVNRLSVGLNQEITRLNRLKDLTNGVYLSAARITAKYRWSYVDPSATAGKETWRDQYLEELVESRVTVDGSFVEMVAIGNVINDSELSSLVEKLRQSVPRKENFSTDEWDAHMKCFETAATALHEKIQKLLEITINTAEI